MNNIKSRYLQEYACGCKWRKQDSDFHCNVFKMIVRLPVRICARRAYTSSDQTKQSHMYLASQFRPYENVVLYLFMSSHLLIPSLCLLPAKIQHNWKMLIGATTMFFWAMGGQICLVGTWVELGKSLFMFGTFTHWTHRHFTVVQKL